MDLEQLATPPVPSSLAVDGYAGPDEATFWFLKVLNAAGGPVPAGDGYSVVAAFCDDRDGADDTYNLSEAAGYSRTMHSGWGDGNATVEITDAGRAVLWDAEGKQRPAVDLTPWRCFHCHEVFTEARHARDHFGHDEGCKPACQIKAGGERGLLEALRDAEKDASDAWFALQNESSTTAKAFRAMQGRHLRQITAAEQAGYERGLRDAQAHPETLGLVAASGSPPWQQGASAERSEGASQ